MEEKNGLHRMLASMQTGLLDQINALKRDVDDTTNDVDTMLKLSATLEGKTTSQEKFIDKAADTFKVNIHEVGN